TEFYVHVKGKASDVENITVSSLSPTLDLTDIDVGNYKFKEIVFTLPDGVELVGEYLVDITVSTPEEPESPTPTLPAETSSATPAATSSANTATKNPNDSAVSSATANPSATHLVQSSEPEVSASAATDENHTGQPENNSASAEN
ncbi:MAG: hypothetical protein IJZ90_04595, partial [Clostridia bacterium]|nr:hypothetical protein [Clostridia bacterium]